MFVRKREGTAMTAAASANVRVAARPLTSKAGRFQPRVALRSACPEGGARWNADMAPGCPQGPVAG